MAESNDSNELYPIAVLIDELKHSDAALRMKSMKNVQTIAIALGCERTRQELIPFLSEAIDDDDDVLLELAGQLAEFIPHVGGPDYAYTLLQPLEALVTVEEITVRTKSLEAVNVVGKNLSSEHFVEYFMPMLRRLVGVDWFTSRVSACGIFAVAYGKAPDSSTRSECIGIFGNLCRDDTPMVRRAAAKALGEIIKVADGDIIVEYLVPQFVKLAKDNQDSVKLLAMENGVALTQRLPENKSKELVLPIILELAADTSWRVRWSVGKGFGDMCEAMGESTVTSGFLDSFEKLLRDSEAEVRAVTAGNIGRAMAHIPSEVAISKIIPTVTTIVQDQSEHVRAGVAGSIMSMSETLGKDLSIEHLLPLFLQLLKDSNSDVRFNVISNLDAANKVIGVDLLAQSLLPAIVDLASDKQWRVRFAIIEYIPLLASQLGVDFFNEKLATLCMTWLGDSVFSIRAAAVKNLAQLSKIFGVEWACENIVPKIIALYNHSNYLFRMTSLACVQALSGQVGKEVLRNSMLPLVLNAASDPVPNIRFQVAKMLAEISTHLDTSDVQSSVKPALKTLLEDGDRDVQYFAEQSLKVC